MKQARIFSVILTACCLLAFQQQATAQFKEGTIMTTIGGYPALDSSRLATVVSGGTTSSTASYTPYSSADYIINVVGLKIDEGKAVYFKSNFSARVSLTLECTPVSGSVTTISNVKLQVNYDSSTGAKYVSRDYKTYKGYKTLKVTVDSVIVSGYTGWQPLSVLEVTNELRPERYYSLSTTPGDLLPTLTTSQPTSDVLKLSWYYPVNAHENITQLEWAYVEKDMLSFYEGDYNLVFNSNSARVDLDEKDVSGGSPAYRFKIPLLFPDTGRLYYRTRAALRKANGSLVYGDWSVDSFAIADGHQANLNWQSSTTFAEQGKYKTVIQYFDGSLRGRQTVTKDNTTGNTVVGETIYDLQGRPNIQILPTPTIDNTIQYFTNFNRFNGMAANDDPAKYFDLTPESLKCDTLHSLNTYYGNGRYYSPQNDWLTTEAKSKFIPDAQGFAFTETRYTDDATQRVKIQGGVGLDHQIGMGHETKYFYGKPSQPELDALFGTEAGDASHYSKNMVQDANGQLSVSYVDMHGRTVATALAGAPTPGIDSVINSTDYPLAGGNLKNDLLTKATNIVQGNSIVSVSTILVDANNNFDFTYKLTPGILSLQNCNSQSVCFDCKYNLEISIKGENCGNDTPVIRRYNNLQVATSSQCTTPMGFIGEGITTPVTEINFSAFLQTGSYVIRKTLTVNDSMYQVRRDSAVKAFMCKTETQIYSQILDSLAILSGCGNNNVLTACDSCQAKLGNFSNYKTKYLDAISPETVSDSVIHIQFAIDSAECANACGGTLNPQFSTLKTLRDQMLRDMIPFTGQYATDTIIKNNLGQPDSTSLDARYNIFTGFYVSGGTTITTDKPYYKHPLTVNGLPYYLDDELLVDSLAHGHANSTQTILDTITRPVSFAGIFQNSWAESLVKRHPEYSKWKYADSVMKASYNWLDSVQACTSYTTALAKGYTVPVKVSTSTINDPFFLLPGTSAEMDTIDHKLYDGIMDSVNASGIHFPIWRGPSIWKIANGSVLCAVTDSAHKLNCINTANGTGLSSSITVTVDKDEVWEKFKTIYLSIRNEAVLRYINQNAPAALSQADMDRLSLVEGKKLIFARSQDHANQNGWSWLQGLTNAHHTDTIGIAHYTDSVKLDDCAGMKPLWKARLMQCDSLRNLLLRETHSDSLRVDTILNKILDSMVMICHNSQTATQPYGASNVNPAYSGNPRTFESVINNVFNSYGISTAGYNYYYCNPYTIDFPKPFGLNPPVAINYVNKLDSCNCGRYEILKMEAASKGYNPFSFSGLNQFLRAHYNDTLTLTLWTGLKKCKNSYTDTCCRQPQILTTSVGYTGSAYFLEVTYNPLVGCDSCKIYMYSTSNVLQDSITNICGTSSSIFNVADECTPHKFVIKCYNAFCGLIVSDTALYECSSSFMAAPSALKGCESPNITSAVSYVFGKSRGILVSYTLPSGTCDSCVLYVYNQASSQILQVNGICGTTSQLLTSLDTCGHYKFLVKCYTEECGTVSSDTAYYNKNCDNDGCQYPQIDSVAHIGTDNLIYVGYTLPSACDSCKIYLYSETNVLLDSVINICGTTDTLFNVADTCAKYKFRISCYNPDCGIIWSDTAFYNGCTLPCDKPVITAIALQTDGEGNYFTHLNYLLPAYCDSCRIYMYDEDNNLVDQINNICGTTDTAFVIRDTCAVFQFVIKCNNPTCGEMISDTAYYYRNCTNTDSCLVFKPVLLPTYEPLPPFLNCGYQKPCITCDKLVNVITPEFRTLFPSYSGVPYLDSTATDDQSKQNALWARFLNYRTGFSKSTMEYMTAYKNCTDAPPSITMLCASGKPLNDPSDLFPKDSVPCKDVITQAQFITQLKLSKIKDSLLAKFDSLYMDKCLSAQSLEQFYVNYRPKEYHYTLYYYDMAGNLVKTLPPAAVSPNYSSTFLDSVVAARAVAVDLTNYRNNTLLATNHRYNSLNQVVAQRTPDAGGSRFWYDRLGRLVISQNSKQIADSRYSYTLYDDLGRITQVGEKRQTQTISQDTTINATALKRWLDDVAGGGSLKDQITRTVYDVAYYNADSALEPVLIQQNLRNRVSYTQVIDREPSDFLTNSKAFLQRHTAATYFSYDIHGNVDTLLQDIKGLLTGSDTLGNRFKKMVYEYDLISGKVNRVVYQPGMSDQFYHQYTYDGENRIINVLTSHDSIYWESDAAYEYYRHGPLSGTVLGANHIQGLDYAYTLQGWLKGVNATALTAGVYDIGKDGAPSGNGVARDAFGYSLNYFYGDYKPIGTGSGGFNAPFVSVTNSLSASSDGTVLGKDLFNGNIKAMMVNIPKLGEAKLYGYRYDQLNRIKAMNSFNGFNNNTNLFSSSNNPTVTEDYRERVTYEPNGNIKKYVRHGAAPLSGGVTMDSLSYGYNFDGSGNLLNNKLRHVKDPVSSGNYTEDIDNQADDNYAYDSIGNMIADAQAGISAIEWTVYGKIQKITKSSGDSIVYRYDASGNLIGKFATISGVTTKMYYIRDASGNVMSLYSKDTGINSGALSQMEVSLYGSSRLGVWNLNRDVSSMSYIDYSNYSSTFTRGNKFFELSNHLGNVLATITDKHIGVDSTNDGYVDYYMADISTANDYYPFGMIMSGRKYQQGTSSYRYGMNGQERSTEVNDNSFTAEFWQYDSRIGRRWNVDPKLNISLSPYNCFAGNPILLSDVNGDTIRVTSKLKSNPAIWGAFTVLGKSSFKDIYNFYVTSKTADIYINSSDHFDDQWSFVAGDGALAITDPELRKNGYVKPVRYFFKKSNGEVDVFFPGDKLNEYPYLADFDGHDVTKSNGAEISLVTLNEKYSNSLDKYQIALIVGHEIYAHVQSPGSADAQHDAFGGTSLNLSLSPYVQNKNGESTNTWIFRPLSPAWNLLKEVLKQKIDNKDATISNTLDYKAMLQYENSVKKANTSNSNNSGNNKPSAKASKKKG